ncbi:tyrosine-type recombinase/integrase [Metapseudomonas resinovorans]|uniref:Uncharacterized protein n=1 Tax=Metapseudomonas resinovorans NBRC 106553 TaxID=1245471 RepID=S6AE93_METRE|nr:tyrosine-type recombinase/integrase [Pseudomonas resinovorans]BAN47887.1 hypothetical protein PCA10_21550 [Pseudomonas resinovorans NBRC 106553]
MNELRRKVLLPVFQLSELTMADDPRALKRVIKQGKGHPGFSYFYRFTQGDQVGQGFKYNLFPVILDRNSAPWHLGNLYILAKLEADTRPTMTTFQVKADDLGAYKEWLDTHESPDDLVFQFPKIKLRRSTYRYRGYLQQQIYAGEVTPATAKRRMVTVVAFYRWLIDSNYFQPEYPPWEESEYQLNVITTVGRGVSKRVVSTDVSIRAPKSEDPFAGTIQDGGKLRPLNGKEQNWILEATSTKGNTECYLIQLFMLATGARIQTAGTLRMTHFMQPDPVYARALTGDGQVFKLKVGPGTGIDTKNDKSFILQVPRPIYEMLHVYSLSNRAEVRRSRFVTKHGEIATPYLFLTQQGNPYYSAKAESLRFDPNLDRRHEKTGQAVRQFLKEHVLPYVREHHDRHFNYRIHDLRASFGMNMTELLMESVNKKVITLSRARMYVKDLLCHESFATTDRYLDYRQQMEVIYQAVNDYGKQLQAWIDQAMKGIELADE